MNILIFNDFPVSRLIHCLLSGFGRDYFLHDPDFPDRLSHSGYYRTVDFLQFLFRKYAQYGLTKPSDRETAISSLARLMARVWQTEWRDGIFASYLHRLLLWHRPIGLSGTDNSAPEVTYTGQFCSWSWMVFSQIEFFTVKDLDVPDSSQLNFDHDSKLLLAQVREVACCEEHRQGRQIHLVHTGIEDAGVVWMDTESQIKLNYCVVIGVEGGSEERQKADTQRTYYILVVDKEPQEQMSQRQRFRRVGAGKIKSHCVSRQYAEGSIV